MTRESTSKIERRRVRIRREAVALAAVLAAAFPPAALGDSSGGTAPPPPPALHPIVRPSGPVNPAFQLSAPVSSFAGSRVTVTGTLRHGAGRVVHVQYRTLGGAWALAASLRAARDGSFSTAWKPKDAGAYELRAAVHATHTRFSGSRSISIFKAQIATWYGPGFYGKSTACGVTLTEYTVGVAHRSLPCGTPVLVTYAGRGVVAPVIDRGPYSKAAQWDLTGATAQAIGMSQTSRIGVLVGNPGW